MKHRHTWVLGLVSVALVLATIPAIAAGPEQSGVADDTAYEITVEMEASESRGLGWYGTDGPIDRANVPNPSVRDRAIDLANSAQFAEIRRTWDEKVDFVDQIDYQIDFRQDYDFLASDDATIAAVLSERAGKGSTIFDEMQIFLSQSERTEIQRRIELHQKTGDVRDGVVGRTPSEEEFAGGTSRYGAAFGGVWSDDQDGGKVKVAIVRDELTTDLASRIRSVFSDPGTELEIIEVTYSLDDLNAFAAAVGPVVEAAGADVVASTAWYPDPISNTVVIASAARFRIPGVPEDAATWTGEPANYRTASGPVADHGSKASYGGLGITLGWQEYPAPGGLDNPICTSAFGMTTSSYYYLLTAGHCLNLIYEYETGNTSWSAISGYSYDVYMSAGQTVSGTPTRLVADGYIYARKGGVYDVARIQNTGVSATNCYHSGNDNCTYRIQYRLSLYGHGIGDDICASLAKTNTYRCGQVSALNVSSNGLTGLVKWDDAVSIGDSGAGVKWNYTAHGVVSLTSGSSSLFVPIYRAVNGLGANVICDTAATKGRVCAVVMD